MRYLVFITGLIVGSMAWSVPVCAQDTGPPERATPTDTLQTATETQQRRPTQSPSSTTEGGPVEDAVQLSARDSLIITMDGDEGNEATLYGNAEITYGDATLTAHRINMLLEQNLLRAFAPSDDAPPSEYPSFQRGQSESFSGRTLSYNLQTQRGRVVGARTTMEGGGSPGGSAGSALSGLGVGAASGTGFVEGSVMKMFEDSTLFVAGGTYTTCDCGMDTPSYSLRSSRMKVAGKWVYTGPIQLYLFNIPTPLWLPFGFLPNIQGRRSGPLPPQYGEDERGFYLSDWGWYFAMNDYMDLQLRFGVWSQGSWEASSQFRYDKRYNYSGNLRFSFTRNRRGEEEDPDFSMNNQWRLNWSHNQTINPTSSFSGSANFVSSSQHLRLDSDDFNDRVRQSISSNVRYSKRWGGGDRRLSVNASQRQSFADGSVNMTLPNLSFSQTSIKPFERDQRPPGQDEQWYERITTRYSGQLQNRYNFQPLSEDELVERGDSAAADITWYEALVSPSQYRRATGDDEPFDFTATHRVPLSVSFFLDRYRLNISPSINFDSEWFLRTQRRQLRMDTTQVEPDSIVVEPVVEERSVPGFFARREFNTSLSTNTTFYGLFPIGVGSFQGLRHTVRPSLSFSYQPNFNSDFWGYTRTYTDADSNEVRYDIATGRRVSRSSEQRSLSFSIDNVFETKQVEIDSTGEEQSQTLQLLNLNASTGYNFAADSLKLSTIRTTARTNIRNQYRISFNATFSPYATSPQGTLIDRYMIENSVLTPLRLTNLGLTFNTSFEGGQSGRRTQGRNQPPAGGPPNAPPQSGPPQDRRQPQQGQPQQDQSSEAQLQPYENFSIPWSLDLNTRYSLRKTGTSTNRDLTLDASFSAALTPNWQVRGRTGFDFIDRELTSTEINITREFCCWMMSFRWVPFGQFQSYGFSLQLKSGPLRDLLRLNLPNADPRGRFGGALGGAGGGRF